MANLRDIRRRIKSVKNTAQITRAMQLVAAAKMKKAQDQALAGRDYAGRLQKMLCHIREAFGDEVAHPLLEKREGKRELVLIVSTDKGLCGPLNTNIARRLKTDIAPDADFVTVGRKLRVMLEKLGRNVLADFSVKDPVPFAQTRPVAKFLADRFLEGKYDTIRIAYTGFVNTLRQEPRVVTLLPAEQMGVGESCPVDMDPAAAHASDLVFEPNVKEVLASILPLYVNYQVYQAVLESRASEHSARMVAMKSATDNAKKFIKELTLEYNKLRQSAITSELLEITTAMKAME